MASIRRDVERTVSALKYLINALQKNWEEGLLFSICLRSQLQLESTSFFADRWAAILKSHQFFPVKSQELGEKSELKKKQKNV